MFQSFRWASNCTAPVFSGHSDLMMPYIFEFGTKEQIKEYIPKMMTGECIGAIAMTEPQAGRLIS